MCRQLTETGLVADERDTCTPGRLGELSHDGGWHVLWCQRLQRLDGGLAVGASRQQIGRLPRAHERTREDLVDRYIQAFEAAYDVLEAADAALGQRALGVVRPLVAALSRYRVPHQVEFHARHSRPKGSGLGPHMPG